MDVLSKELDIFRHLSLEASAGTGKSFSILHLYIRHIVDPERPLKVGQILVVTFTNAAVKDLKKRIEEGLLAILENRVWPPYLEGLDEKTVLKKIFEAYSNFSEAKIFTIHGFAARSLKQHAWSAKISMKSAFVAPNALFEMRYEAVRDVMRTLPEGYFSKSQLRFVLNSDKFEKEVLATKPKEMVSIDQLFRELSQITVNLKNVSEELAVLCKNFKGITSKIKEAVDSWIDSFSQFVEEPTFENFDLLLAKGNPLQARFKEDNRLVKSVGALPPLFYTLVEEIFPLVARALSQEDIKGHLHLLADRIIEKRVQEMDQYGPDDLLKLMHQKVKEEPFAKAIQDELSLVMCDEFQDTDQLQWDIFKTLFTDTFNGYLYLVGDPKQSIYRFRDADIYTYFEAVLPLEKETLNVNYRSHPQLVKALNQLFSIDFIPLPKYGTFLKCPPVAFAKPDSPPVVFDDYGHLHAIEFDGLIKAQEEIDETLLPFVVQEIQKYGRASHSLNEIAILVKDRHQAKRVQKFLTDSKVSCYLLRKTSWEGAIEIKWLHLLLDLFEQPFNGLLLKTLLGTSLIGYNLEQLLLVDAELSTHFQRFSEISKVYHELGIASAFHAFVKIYPIPDPLVHARCLELIDLVVESPPYLVKRTLDRLYLGYGQESSPPIGQEGVPILTMHTSKGLEWDIVFALGVAMPQKDLDDQELVSELMRQFYVGLTRAKERLYLPVPTVIGNRSIIDLYLQRVPTDIVTFSNGMITKSDTKAYIDPDLSLIFKPVIEEEILATPNIVKREDKILSFTALQVVKSTKIEGAPRDEKVSLKTVMNLPAGRETGILLHALLERVPLNLFHGEKEAIRSFIEESTKDHPLKEWVDVLLEILWNTFHTPLAEGFMLKDIDPKYFLREASFLFREGDEWRTGVIDAVIQHKGITYIIDYKSSWLGADLASYETHKLDKVIEDQGYRLQACLYEEAIKKGLNEGVFGGSIYLFLRGSTHRLIKGGAWK